MSGEKKKLGKIMLQQRLVSQDELDTLLTEQKSHPGHRLASVAEKSGRIDGKALLKALSEQHGLPGIDLAQVVVPLENLALIPADIARRHLILPILVKDDRIFLAMADPTDRRVIDEIEFVTGRRVFPYVALHDALIETIDEAYRLAERGEDHYVGSHVPQDYLASLGLAGATISSEPPASPSGVVAEAHAAAGGDLADDDLDDLGLSELESRVAPTPPRTPNPQSRAATHEPFGSQVSPLPTAPTKERPQSPKILIVDDEDDIRKLLARVMTQKGYQVVESARGLDALQKVRDENPDVILLDAMLPEVHGFEICRRIKGSKKYGDIPVIMVSAIYRGWRVAEDLKASYGVDAFLEKPFKISDIIAQVERVLAGRATEVPEDDMSGEASRALESGMEKYRAGDLDGAIEVLREGLTIDPLSFQLHYHLGLLCGRREDVFDAIHELGTAVDLQPRNFSALKNLAVLFQRAGFKHKAIEMWERALSSAPDVKTRQGIKDHLMTLL